MIAEDQHRFSIVAERVAPGSRLVSAVDLEGGVSARTVAIEFETKAGELQKAVVRLHGETDRAANPNIAADEFRLLELADAAGLPVPVPLFLDRTCALFDLPYLVVEFVEGEPVFEPVDETAYAIAIARQLAAIHRLSLDTRDLTFLPRNVDRVVARLERRPASLDEDLSEGLIREALDSAWPSSSCNPASLLHGDYWPGNLLWNNGEIAAVIDWEDAATGDPLADLSNCRLELCWALGERAMESFTQHYKALMVSLDYRDLPCWDLYAALRPAGKLTGWGLEKETCAAMVAAHRRFVDAALSEFARRSDG